MRAFLLLLCYCLSFSVLADWHSHEFDVMGTRAKVEFEMVSPKTSQATQPAQVLLPSPSQLIQSVFAEMNRIDRLMSPYKPTSELSYVNQNAAKSPVVISVELYQLLQRSIAFSELTDGAFDITFSSVGYLYDYRKAIIPDSKQIERLKSAINFKNIQLDKVRNTVFFSDPRVKIDLGGIAKGHAVDNCIQLLKSAGIVNAYVNAGGDSRLIGRKNERLWYIGVRHPRDENKLLVNLPLEDVSLSTSGDYERFFIQDGVRYHHIIDPGTGKSAHAIQSATILANDSTTADALSTSIFVLGVDKGMALVNRLDGISAIMVDSEGKTYMSNDLTKVN